MDFAIGLADSDRPLPEGQSCKADFLMHSVKVLAMNSNTLIMILNVFSTFINEFLKCGRCSKMFTNVLICNFFQCVHLTTFYTQGQLVG